jgi:hypothetical protein
MIISGFNKEEQDHIELCELNEDIVEQVINTFNSRDFYLKDNMLADFIGTVTNYLNYKEWDFNDVGVETSNYQLYYNSQEINKILERVAQAVLNNKTENITSTYEDNIHNCQDGDIPF